MARNEERLHTNPARTKRAWHRVLSVATAAIMVLSLSPWSQAVTAYGVEDDSATNIPSAETTVETSDDPGFASGAATDDATENASDENVLAEDEPEGLENAGAKDAASTNTQVRAAKAPKATANGVACIGDTGYATLAEAIASAGEGDIVTLNEDVTESVTVDKGITLDLNGNTLTAADGSAITTSAAVTVRNGTIKGGTGTKAGWKTYGGGIYATSSSIAVQNVEFTGNDSWSGAAVYATNGVDGLTVTGCTMTGNTCCGALVQTAYDYTGDVTVTDNTITDNKAGTRDYYGAVDVHGDTIVIQGNTVASNSSLRNDDINAVANANDSSSITFDAGGSYAGTVNLTGYIVNANGADMETPDGFGLAVTALKGV